VGLIPTTRSILKGEQMTEKEKLISALNHWDKMYRSLLKQKRRYNKKVNTRLDWIIEQRSKLMEKEKQVINIKGNE
jgi:hypothetical protein